MVHMMMVKVFDICSGKWVFVNDQVRVEYTSNERDATVFDLMSLKSANGYLEDFAIYRRTLRAVPIGSNREIHDCDSVSNYIKKARNDS